VDLWFTEKQTHGAGLTLKVRETLLRERTPFQELVILDTEQYGRMLVLDGMIQTAVGDEFIYHEMITHVAMFTHPRPRRVVVIGGGDGGVVREVLKHPTVEKVVLVEIDGRVIEACRTYLPEIAACLDDPRVEIRVEDGIRHVKEHQDAYDVAIVDSTEPVGAAVGLFSPNFYADIHDCLTDDGILVAQTESPFYNQDLIKRSYAAISALFPVTRVYLAAIPTYPSGLWSFTLGSKQEDPLEVEPQPVPEFRTRYYTTKLHHAAFCLPRFVQELLV